MVFEEAVVAASKAEGRTKAHGNSQCEHLVSQMESRLCDTWNRGYVCQSKWNRG